MTRWPQIHNAVIHQPQIEFVGELADYLVVLDQVQGAAARVSADASVMNGNAHALSGQPFGDTLGIYLLNEAGAKGRRGSAEENATLWRRSRTRWHENRDVPLREISHLDRRAHVAVHRGYPQFARLPFVDIGVRRAAALAVVGGDYHGV